MQRHWQIAERYGAGYNGKPQFDRGAGAKPRSHDDGRDCGPFLGGLGTANFSRGLDGRFSRWQLQQGAHVHQTIDAAFIALSWTNGETRYYRRLTLGEGESELPWECRSYAALWPCVYEHFDHPTLPARILLEYHSPTIPGENDSAALPVTFFTVDISGVKPGVGDVSVSLVWPNLNGWRLMPLTSAERSGLHWPNQTHAGQINRLAELGNGECHIAQTHQPLARGDVSGTVMISGQTSDAELNFQVSAKANQNETGVPYAEQPYTLACLEETLRQDGRLPDDTRNWSAHWHEPLVSAINARFGPNGGAVNFAVTMDWPLTRFGQGRLWRKAYTARWGSESENTLGIAKAALADRKEGLERLEHWHRSVLARLADWPDRVAGAVINELHTLVAAGSAWVHQPDPAPDSENSHFRGHEHIGILEGFDSGYFYYNTLDLWVYAFPALSESWPTLSETVFSDYLDTVALTRPTRRPVYRDGQWAPYLVENKLPHDLGSPAEDPWVALNGYVMRDDPNLWKDHNPSFIVSFFQHRQRTGQQINDWEYQQLLSLANFVETQVAPGEGIPQHGAFGDSTWDNLDMRGLSAYAGGFVMAAWAVMAELASQRQESERECHYRLLLQQAQASFDTLWSGEAYRTNSEGKYRNATMADALIGVFYARRCGLGDLVPPARARGHLLTTFRNNHRNYHNGRFGPLLVAEPEQRHYSRDGGEELQVNEVLVGSAWVLVAMLAEYGLKSEADQMAERLVDHLYLASGLQFRTPAAWDGNGRFRAPINMRVLSIAWLLP